MKQLDYTCIVPSNRENGAEDTSSYLTCDDGSKPLCTLSILNVLAEHPVSAARQVSFRRACALPPCRFA